MTLAGGGSYIGDESYAIVRDWERNDSNIAEHVHFSACMVQGMDYDWPFEPPVQHEDLPVGGLLARSGQNNLPTEQTR